MVVALSVRGQTRWWARWVGPLVNCPQTSSDITVTLGDLHNRIPAFNQVEAYHRHRILAGGEGG